MPTRTGQLNLTALLLATLIAASALLPAVCGEEKADDVIESFKVEGNGDDLIVPVTVGGRTYQFALDTGCSRTVFDASLRDKLIPTGDFGHRKGEAVRRLELYECPDAFLGKAKLPLAQRAVCVDLSQFRTFARDDVRGLLGMDFLRRYVIEIDFDSGLVAVLRNARNSRGEQLQIHDGRGGIPTITVRLPEIGDRPFEIDTGLTGLTNGALATGTFKKLVSAHAITDVADSEVLTVDGRADARSGAVSWISVGAFRHANEKLGESSGDVNFLGNGYLSRYKVTFDFPNRALYLHKGKQYHRKFPLKYEVAVRFDRDELEFVVDFVSKDGPAYQSGIRVGQRVIEIDSVPAREMTPHAAMLLLADPPDGLRLLVASPGRSARSVRLGRGTPATQSAKAPP